MLLCHFLRCRPETGSQQGISRQSGGDLEGKLSPLRESRFIEAMEDAEGGLSFDFEGGLETAATAANPALDASVVSADPTLPLPSILEPANNPAGQKPPNHSNRRSFRQTVCRHWLRSLCMKGDACGFLHQLDKARMPVCRFFARYGECREQDCVYKHTNDDVKECNMYKLGFCPNGPDCRYRHQKVLGPPPPVEEVFRQIQQWPSTANGAYPIRHSQQRHNNNHHQGEKSQWQQQPSVDVSQRPPGNSSLVEDCQNQQGTPRLLQQQPNQNQAQSLDPFSNGLSSQPNTVPADLPLPQGRSRYFIVKSSNRENLELSVQQGMWATQRNNEGKLNEAFDSCENVILIFSVNRTRHFQGCAKMTSKIGGFVGGGGWKYAHGTAHYGRNFCLKWLKLCELSFHKTRHLRNPYNENLPVKISRDCQELEPSVGEQLASLLYLEPDSELMATAWAVESKREEEKAQDVSPAHESEDPNIVPFEDNDDDQDEDESEEESSSQTHSANQGRGRGRGMMWPPHGPVARVGRGMIGSKPMGFNAVMVGGDGYGFDRFGMGAAEGFAMPDMFSTPAGLSQGFPPYGHQGPRFAGPEFSTIGPPSAMNFPPMDGPVSAPGMIFHGRPPPTNGIFPHGAPRMMIPASAHAPILGGSGGPTPIMGAVRPHFLGGAGAAGRSIRLAAVPYHLPQGGNGGKGRRDQKRRRNECNDSTDRLSSGMEQRASGKAQQMQSSGEALEGDSEVKFHRPAGSQCQDRFETHNYAVNNDGDSESEDEAPRRSRHGESKKKRHDWEGEEGEQADHWELPLTGGC